ncbi:MAG TPA: ubiquinone/menaquinone biosynthesis methyltransferase [Thermoanaerobaculia bacterium]|jgi:demethylmenaquinone methyltransferase/2-methoxy-6-polyprenyl-1,4-benzoquinol methylase|nr:ubiquinone/menaquinone biosynthesis methyltransferase [Thermoanaerobaculia bacterium]
MASVRVDKSGTAIRDMFAGVAPRYDLLNHLLSGALDFLWRRRAAAVLRQGARAAGAPVLDLCCGTGDQAAADAAGGTRVAAADFCVPMLALARRKFLRRGRRGSPEAPRPQALAADALALPFPDRAFGGATVSFGLRNVADLDAALRQIARVLQPGGRLVVLEFALPRRRPLRALYLFYFRRLLPGIGRLLSPRGSAYSYLPESVLQFPQRQDFLDRMAAAGFAELAWEDLAAGAVCLYQGRTLA